MKSMYTLELYNYVKKDNNRSTETKSVCLDELASLIKDIINNKSRPAHNRLDNFIKNVLLNRIGFKSEPEN
jgi:hypothetical protein